MAARSGICGSGGRACVKDVGLCGAFSKYQRLLSHSEDVHRLAVWSETQGLVCTEATYLQDNVLKVQHA